MQEKSCFFFFLQKQEENLQQNKFIAYIKKIFLKNFITKNCILFIFLYNLLVKYVLKIFYSNLFVCVNETKTVLSNLSFQQPSRSRSVDIKKVEHLFASNTTERVKSVTSKILLTLSV